MGVPEKIAEIKAEIARTQKNKKTEYHLGLLKAKLAKLRVEMNSPKQTNSKLPAFEVKKSGNARIALIGFPSVGKSTLLSKITTTKSKVAEHEFTTLDCISGMLYYKGASIQILDLPGIISGAASNKGRGKQIISTARTADLIIMMLDYRRPVDLGILTNELYEMGIRLNKKRPNASLQTGTGQQVNISCNLTKMTESTVRAILNEYKLHNCSLSIREDIDEDDLIDVISNQAVYVKCMYCYNKIDELSKEDFLEVANDDKNVVISCHNDWNLEGLLESIWEELDLVRIYTKKKSDQPNFDEPMILKKGSTIKDLCNNVHVEFYLGFKHAYVWGLSARHSPQKVGLAHVLEEEDVVQLFMK